MLPADERLEADDLGAFERHDRLVVDAQLSPFERRAQVALELDPLQGLGTHGRLEERVSLGGVALRADHGDLGFAKQLVWRRSPGLRQRDAHRRTDEPLAVVERERGTQLGHDPVGDAPRLVGIGDRVEDDPEFVAADARDGVARAHAAHEPLADGDEQPVAHEVAEALVDDLEPVEAEQDHRDGPGVVRLVAGEGVRDPVGQELAIGEPGRRVVERPTLGDVDEPGVVERDRRELAEARQRADVPAAPAPRAAARSQAQHADDPAARRERNADDRTEDARRQRRRTALPRVVVVDRERASGRDDAARQALVDPHATAEIAIEETGPHPDLHFVSIRFAQVQEPVRRPEQGDRATHDHVQQAIRIVVIEQREGRLVEGTQVGIGHGSVRTRARRRA